MAESMREIIAKIKASQQNSQQSKAAPAPSPKSEIEKMIRQETAIEFPKLEEKPAVIEQPKQEQPKQEQRPTQAELDQITQDIEMLQNDGRFRVELLSQLNGIRESLNAIAELLIILAKNEK